MAVNATHLQYRAADGTAQVIPIGENPPKDATRVKRVVEVKTKTVEAGVKKASGKLDGVHVEIPQHYVDNDVPLEISIKNDVFTVAAIVEIDDKTTKDLICQKTVPAGSEYVVKDGVSYIPA